MKIEGNNPVDGMDSYGKIKELKKNQEIEKNIDVQKTDGDKDKISLSDKAKEISELKSLIEQFPEIRTDRVEELKNVVDTGAYDIDSMKVAEKILEEI